MLLFILLQNPPACDQAKIVAFEHAAVLTMTQPSITQSQTVLVKDGRIAAVASDVAIPANACRINARGKVLLPGLADMHVHTSESELPLYIANGVTTIRELNGSPEHLALRARIAKGEVLGPRLLISSPLLAGEKQRFRHRLISNADEAYVAAHEFKNAGYDLLKIYDGLSAQSYQALVTAGRALGLRLTGHIPEAVGFDAVLAANQDLEHLDKIQQRVAGHSNDTTVITGVRAKLKGRQIWLTPTLASQRALAITGTAEFEAWFAGPQVQYIDSGTLEWWSSLRRGVRRADGPTAYYQWQTRLLNGLYRDGAQIMLGTDTGNPLMVPGFAVHAELEALVNDAGMSTFDAIATATVNVGRHLSDKTGTIVAGAPADLIMVDDDPLQDLRVLRRPTGVMVRGRWLDRAQLDALLASAKVR